MAPRYLTNDLPKRLIGIRPTEDDLTQDSGYHSSDGTDRPPAGSDTILLNKRYQARPLKRHCVPPPVPPRYLCGTCKTLFDTLERLSQHIKANSTTCAASDGHWMCGKCRNTFTESRSLKRHAITTGCMMGTTKASYSCQTCRQVYGRKDNLNRHEKTHRGQHRRKTAHTKTVPTSTSIEVTAHPSNDSVVHSYSIVSPNLSNMVGCETRQTLRSSSSSDQESRLGYYAQTTGSPLTPVTPNDRLSSVLTTGFHESASSRIGNLQFDSAGFTQRAQPPVFFPHRDSLDLPLRPKHASKRPGPTRRTTKCPSCHKMIGISQQELEAHAKSHPGGRYSLDLLCTQCMICFEREEDFVHHNVSASRYGNCGFLNHKDCGGHHPLAEGEVSPHPDGDHARMRIVVQNWELKELQDYQLRHDETAKALPDQGEDCERWTLGCRSLETASLWSQRSRPLSKKSAPSYVDYTARTPFRNFADRYEQVKAVATSRNRNRSWQIKCREDLAVVGAITNKDSDTLAEMLREGRNPNILLHTVDTRVANMKYSEKLSGRHKFISPLILASEQGFLDGMSRLICAGADINAIDDNCRTALDWAMSRHNKMACAVLLAHGAHYVEHGDRHVEDACAFLQAAKDELISSLIRLQRESPFIEPFACYAYRAILDTDETSFRTLLSFGFSMDSKAHCDGRSFRDLAQGMAPHLLNITPRELDLQLLLDAIAVNDVLAIRTILAPGTVLPRSLCSGDAILDYARSTIGVWQEVIDVLADAITGVGLSKPAQESFCYSRVGIIERG